MAQDSEVKKKSKSKKIQWHYGEDIKYDDNKKFVELEEIFVENPFNYLHKFRKSRETIIEKCVKLDIVSFYEKIIVKHEEVKTDKTDATFKEHIRKALVLAARINKKHFIDLLLDQNQDLFNLAANDCWKVLDHLNIPDLDQQNVDGNTMLHFAARKGRSVTVRYLIARGANTNAENNSGFTPLTLTLEESPDEDSTISILIENSDTQNILPLCAEKGKYEYIHRLIGKGADPNAMDSKGDYPLGLAAKNGHTLTVLVLLRNEAIISILDKDYKTALDLALGENRDETSALLIRMDPEYKYISSFTQRDDENYTILKLIKKRQKQTLLALLDISGRRERYGRSTREIYWNTSEWDPNYIGEKKIFEALSFWGDEELIYHGTIRLIVDQYMKNCGYAFLCVYFFFFMSFILSLSYSLIQAAAAGIPRSTYTKDVGGIFRILTDLFVLLFFVCNVATELLEFFRIKQNTREYLKRKKGPFYYRTFRGELYNELWIRVLIDYFVNLSNIFDVLGLSSLFWLMILRIANQPVEWVFATLTFFLNAARVFKLIVLIPKLGPYATIIFRILVHDVPLFLSLFSINLLIFTGGYFIALRTPYTSEGLRNVSLMQNTIRTPGTDSDFQQVFLSGIRVLLEGNVYPDNYLDHQINWLAAAIYFAFLFMTVVVLLNVFIAQLSERYSAVKERANHIYAKQKLNFIVQLYTTSIFSKFMNIQIKYLKKRLHIDRDIELSPEGMLKYHHTSDLYTLITGPINNIKLVKQYAKPIQVNVKKPHQEEITEKSPDQEWDIKTAIQNLEKSNMALEHRLLMFKEEFEHFGKLALEKSAVEEKPT
ncbi:hypothetical protein LOD99_14651 [Oopsacas minuta]|uniref:Ion transport domain-containing protein n=1 Tax=Oopsacas minuta TaxID=111878 RepID=A0AAV7KE24_9METZ|nr:hypothetical protein LOD99_14651 [Oopsacas minuta]